MPLTAIMLLAAADSAPASPVCQDMRARMAGHSARHEVKAGKPEHLGKQPPADQIKAVLHSENGCAKPVVVRKNIGSTPIGGN